MSILDFDLKKEVPFDPGYSSSIARVSGNVEYFYSAFSAIPSIKQKRFQFAIIYPKILNAIKLNIAFYLGCLLWGIYLKSLENLPVVNNPCLDTTFDDECFAEIDFLINFVKNGLNRDTKYYLNKTYSCEPIYIEILEKYREFLKLNKGFINTKNTSDIVLPLGLKHLEKKDLGLIFDEICSAVKIDNLEGLLNLAGIIL